VLPADVAEQGGEVSELDLASEPHEQTDLGDPRGGEVRSQNRPRSADLQPASSAEAGLASENQPPMLADMLAGAPAVDPAFASLQARIDREVERRAKMPPAPPRLERETAAGAPGAAELSVVAHIEAARAALEEAARKAPKRPCVGCGALIPALTAASVPATFAARHDEVARPDPGHVCADCYLRREHVAQFALALQSVPLTFRWARFGAPDVGSPELKARVRGCRRLTLQVGDGAPEPKVGPVVCIPKEPAGRKLAGAERLLFLGPTGSGKTSLMAALFHELVDLASDPDVPQRVANKARGARFMHAYELSTDNRKRAKVNPRPTLDEGRQASVLVVDDLGKDPDAFKSAVDEVLHARHACGLPTWITTGLDPGELFARYPTLARRLVERADIFSFFLSLSPPRPGRRAACGTTTQR
jgi:hypothetical protein